MSGFVNSKKKLLQATIINIIGYVMWNYKNYKQKVLCYNYTSYKEWILINWYCCDIVFYISYVWHILYVNIWVYINIKIINVYKTKSVHNIAYINMKLSVYCTFSR